MEYVCALARLRADGRLLTLFLLPAPSCSIMEWSWRPKASAKVDLQATIQQAYLAAACNLRFLPICQ
jgi:hypothetical protein